MSESAPRHVGDMEQTVHSIEINERAEVSEIFYRALHLVANFHPFHEFLSLLAPLLLDQFAPAEHDVFAVVVDLNDLEIVGVTDELLQIFRRNDIDLRCRQKCLDADVHHKPAFHDRFHLAFDQAVAVKNTRDLVPILAIRGFLLRENDHAFVVFESLEEHVYFITDFEILDVLKLGDRNPALGFVTDIYQHFTWTNFQYASLDDAAFTEVRHRFRHYILHLHHKLKGLLRARRRLIERQSFRAVKQRKWDAIVGVFSAEVKLSPLGREFVEPTYFDGSAERAYRHPLSAQRFSRILKARWRAYASDSIREL